MHRIASGAKGSPDAYLEEPNKETFEIEGCAIAKDKAIVNADFFC